MTRRTAPLTFARRAAALAAGLVLATAAVAGCASEGASTDCGVDQCTVTFDRGADGKVSVLGVDAKFVSAEGDKVTLEVGGQPVTLSVNQQPVEVAGLHVSLESLDNDQAVVRIGRNPS